MKASNIADNGVHLQFFLSQVVGERLKRLNDRFFPAHLWHAPQWMVLGVNNLCNLHCKMCDVGTETLNTNFAQNLVGTQPVNMPRELLTNVIDQTAKRWPNAKLGYAFTEPLIYPHLVETLNYAAEKQLYTSVTTNALTLKKLAPDISRVGLDDIFISLDGPESTHDFIRGRKGSFQRAIEGIEALLQEKQQPRISVFCTITQWNTGRLKELADFLRPYPLSTLGFMHTNFTPEYIARHHNVRWSERYPATSSNVEETEVSQTDLDELLKQIVSIRRADYSFPVTFSPEINDSEQLGVFYRQPEKLLGTRCVDVCRNMMIKSDGTVIPAHGRCYNYPVGNVYQDDLGQIWNSLAFRQLRADLKRAGGLFPACSRCCSAFGR